MQRKTTKKPPQTGQVRIIAGQCRGRRITFPPVDDLRPSGDRLRETLFNWLTPDIVGARCLDLFAGSGALGLEAASRHAKNVTLIEQNKQAAQALQDNAKILGFTSTSIIHGDALGWIKKQARDADPFDIIFLDPPFHSTLLEETVTALDQHPTLIGTTSLIYCEMALQQSINTLPRGWKLHRQKTHGDVCAELYQVIDK